MGGVGAAPDAWQGAGDGVSGFVDDVAEPHLVWFCKGVVAHHFAEASVHHHVDGRHLAAERVDVFAGEVGLALIEIQIFGVTCKQIAR